MCAIELEKKANQNIFHVDSIVNVDKNKSLLMNLFVKFLWPFQLDKKRTNSLPAFTSYCSKWYRELKRKFIKNTVT